MAAQQFIEFNNVKRYHLWFNGNYMNEGYMNGVHVFTTLLRLTLPQAVTPVNLRTFINNNNPHGRTRIIVTNNLTQPRLDTGNLAGLSVTLVNNGQFQGAAVGDRGMNITSALTVTNNGWIRGAGGNGGRGGNGGAGGAGSVGGNRLVNYVINGVTQTWAGNTVVHALFAGDPQPNITNGAFSMAPSGGNVTFSGPCGTPVTVPFDPVSSMAIATVCGTDVYYTDDTQGAHSFTVEAGSYTPQVNGSHVIPGGAGGVGGVAGVRGNGGQGVFFGSVLTAGLIGTNGGPGGVGLRNSWTSPEPVLYYGNYGTNGGAGGKGGNGGAGGNWGLNGSTGATGAAGVSGAAGAAGLAGTAGGNATSGWGLVLGGSFIGNMSGTRG